MSDPQTISADKLCALTGLTDRRHRQLAEQGYFPMPIKSQYQLTPTISGMFRYYRDSFQRASRSLIDDRQVKLKREIELLDLKIAEQKERLAPLELVEQIWSGVAGAIRQTILAAEVPQQMKDELCTHLRTINPSDYCRKTDLSGSDPGDSNDSPATDPNGL